MANNWAVFLTALVRSRREIALSINSAIGSPAAGTAFTADRMKGFATAARGRSLRSFLAAYDKALFLVEVEVERLCGWALDPLDSAVGTAVGRAGGGIES